MSNKGRRPLPPRIDDPNHGQLFNKLRARFANLGQLFSLAWKFNAAALAGALALMGANRGSITFPVYFWGVVVEGCLLVALVTTENIRNFWQFETKLVFALFYKAIDLAALVVIGFLLFQVHADWQADRDQRWARDQHERQQKLEEDIRKAHIAECETERKKAVGRLDKRKIEAQKAAEACVAEFNKNRGLFTQGTADQHCQSQQVALDVAARNWRLAAGKRCDTATEQK